MMSKLPHTERVVLVGCAAGGPVRSRRDRVITVSEPEEPCRRELAITSDRKHQSATQQAPNKHPIRTQQARAMVEHRTPHVWRGDIFRFSFSLFPIFLFPFGGVRTTSKMAVCRRWPYPASGRSPLAPGTRSRRCRSSSCRSGPCHAQCLELTIVIFGLGGSV